MFTLLKVLRHITGEEGTEIVATLEKELLRLQKIEDAAKNLVRVKGRYHTEQAFKALQELVK